VVHWQAHQVLVLSIRAAQGFLSARLQSGRVEVEQSYTEIQDQNEEIASMGAAIKSDWIARNAMQVDKSADLSPALTKMQAELILVKA
jgi:hypothetical protein